MDEAHCISEWGHDFRPDYLHIAQARASMGNPLTVALAATATPQVQKDIIRLLGLGDSTRIVTGFNRSNLILNVKYVSGLPSKLRALNGLLSPSTNWQPVPRNGAMIIYTGTRRDAEEVTEFVRDVVKIPAEFYHAGLLPEERTRIQNDFISGKLNVICATNAFGMGIDRADVRQVIHYSIPGSLEAYYQEAGRAGRDGQPSRVTLLYDPEDRALQEFFVASSILAENDLRAIYSSLRNAEQIWTTIEELSYITGLYPVQIKVGLSELERAGALEHLGDEGFRTLFRKGAWNQQEIRKAILHGKEHTQHRQTQLDGIVRYAESNLCRRKIILNHFGDAGQTEAAVVGSRHLDDAGKNCAAFVGNACGLSGMVLYSGGAKGVDTLSMEAALEARGTAVGVLADSLKRAVKSQKDALRRGNLCLVTPYHPNAGFSVGAAMGRNRLIYTLADYAVIVASDAATGGTWAGATEALKNNWIPVFVLEHDQMPEGNKLLLQRGALAFPHPFKETPVRLHDWLKEKAARLPSQPGQPGLF